MAPGSFFPDLPSKRMIKSYTNGKIRYLFTYSLGIKILLPGAVRILIMKENLNHKYTAKKWCLAGIFALSILGVWVHYLYDWTGNSEYLGSILPVNESIWEHLKLGYLSLVLFSIPEYFQIRKQVHNFFLAKLTGILALELSILLIFYTYTGIIGRNIFYLDILSYLVGVMACQYLSFRIYSYTSLGGYVNSISLFAFIAIGIVFGLYTYRPPHAGIFLDHKSQTYGIYKEK